MVLSRRTLKRMENLKSFCSFDTDKRVATIDVHFADVSEIIDERKSNERTIAVNEETLEFLYDGLEIIPNEFQVNYNIFIDDCKNIESKTVEEAFEQAIKDRDYRENVGKVHKHSIMFIFVMVSFAILMVSTCTMKNSMLEGVGLPFAAVIAFFLELMFEVYFEEGVTHFFVMRIYEKFGCNNRLGTICVI